MFSCAGAVFESMPTESQLRDAELRRCIGEKIGAGRLPLMIPKLIDGGYGSGLRCAACDQPITSTQIEYGVDTDSGQLSLHLGCHVLWQMECQTRMQARSSRTPGVSRGARRDRS